MRRSPRSVGLPDALTPAALAACAWGAAAGDWLTGVLPSAAAGVLVALVQWLWVRRGKRWHDGLAIVLLLPALAAALALAVAGPRLAGLALTGLLCTLLGYHGRHHPDERP